MQYATDCVHRIDQISLHSRSSRQRVDDEGKVGNQCMKQIEEEGNPRMDSSGLDNDVRSATAFYPGYQVDYQEISNDVRNTHTPSVMEWIEDS